MVDSSEARRRKTPKKLYESKDGAIWYWKPGIAHLAKVKDSQENYDRQRCL